jgi:hypothetical protein
MLWQQGMSAFEVLISLALAFAVGFQVWLTARVWRSPLFDKSQKLMQSKLIWLLPIVGSMLVFSVLSEDDKPKKPWSQQRR